MYALRMRMRTLPQITVKIVTDYLVRGQVLLRICVRVMLKRNLSTEGTQYQGETLPAKKSGVHTIAVRNPATEGEWSAHNSRAKPCQVKSFVGS